MNGDYHERHNNNDNKLSIARRQPYPQVAFRLVLSKNYKFNCTEHVEFITNTEWVQIHCKFNYAARPRLTATPLTQPPCYYYHFILAQTKPQSVTTAISGTEESGHCRKCLLCGGRSAIGHLFFFFFRVQHFLQTETDPNNVWYRWSIMTILIYSVCQLLTNWPMSKGYFQLAIETRFKGCQCCGEVAFVVRLK